MSRGDAFRTVLNAKRDDFMPAEFDEFIAMGARLADAGGAILGRYFRQPLAIDLKSDDTPVTIADREAETAMRGLITETFPDHGIIGEEHGAERADSDYVWVLDPIDGTRAFLTGKPMFGALIALTRNGTPILGVIDQPVAGERWIGAADRTTRFNGKDAATRATRALDQAIFNTTSPDLFDGADRDAFARLKAAARETHYGGDCYAYGLLASGHIDVIAEAGLKPYDYCALAPVVEGAGGVITDWRGARLTLESDGRVLAAGNAALHAEALEALNHG